VSINPFVINPFGGLTLVTGLFGVFGLGGFILFGYLTSRIASSKGRDPTGWFFIGAFTGLFGLVASLIMLPAEYYETGSSRRPPTS